MDARMDGRMGGWVGELLDDSCMEGYVEGCMGGGTLRAYRCTVPFVVGGLRKGWMTGRADGLTYDGMDRLGSTGRTSGQRVNRGTGRSCVWMTARAHGGTVAKGGRTDGDDERGAMC